MKNIINFIFGISIGIFIAIAFIKCKQNFYTYLQEEINGEVEKRLELLKKEVYQAFLKQRY